ncbi:HAMP domain-containing histidine kinase [Deinococcus metallilatus]|uniref:histidine kinase n=1 Tax=Deinococcus metallilatus TaxID=1211322 RepID=A0AAJ5JZB4_9DEIO|nr:HAMP domain-containing sensor histidine kinase [Deinococcus metallilatus]MBB5294698.1 signal transduction histidine kinase [Deinococcus metallilatus]QBY07728.1 HAMP domain-containing histidine kinase [Deinococcus metallilatus]RXJ14144.1 HAMP domain-containing histidine kinase [Deinococcus metallilatus]TLK30109.1 HAMP domain-containing histidine kinase [Deinococcus metallilatus]GMA15915.1 two-component sensor histidine kinase [Deinococcus metallilatus]
MLTRPSLTLRARLALWAALATALAVGLVAAGLFFAVNSFLFAAQRDRLTSAVGVVQARVESALGRGDDLLAALLGVQGTLAPSDLEAILGADPQTRQLDVRLVTVGGGQVRVLPTPRFPDGIPLNLPPGTYREGDRLVAVRVLAGGRAALTVVSDARALGEAQAAFGRALAWLLPLALGLSLLLGWTVAGRLLAPVRTLEGAAREIGAGGHLRRPVPGAGEGDELARLALTLQETFARLADARDREQDFLRAAAHDLRSPLAALTARVDATLARDRDAGRYRAELREIGTDLTRLSDLANHLLLLARDPAALAWEAVPLRDLAADAVDRARELAPEADVDLIAPQPVNVAGDRVLLGQAIWNLTANAVLHAPGATVTVTVRGDGAGGGVVEVRDDGPGVDAAVLARLGEAFYRPDASRTGGTGGHGLGLALVRRAAELHGGTLKLESAPGAGFTAALHLPARSPTGEVLRSPA